MKYPVTQFKSLDTALKELAPFVRNGRHLQTGRPFARFGGMRSREMLANWLVCVVANESQKRKLTFASDPIGGDGVILDPTTGEVWPTEHVMVTHAAGSEIDIETLVLQAIGQKIAKGEEAYARGKTLIVFLDAGTNAVWRPNSVARKLPDPLHFATVWVVALQGVENGEYVYAITNLDMAGGNAPVAIVRISRDFDAWTVVQQR